jgi:predicted RNA binding protein YcfA (HicA-like mRNA interferase family)
MPRKLRELMADLERAGFVNRGGRGSHRNFIHPCGLRVTLSGQAGADARHYQEKEVRQKIDLSRP